MRFRIAAAVGTAAALIVGLASAQQGATAAQSLTPAESAAAALPQAKPIAWGQCSDGTLAAAGAQCGYLVAPLDYAKPHGATVRIAVSRVLHTVPSSKYQGVMLVNPGGPGGSGLDLSTLGSAVPDAAGNAYDWIGFDPRGVGASTPHLACVPNYEAGPKPDYIPSTKALEQVWLDRTKAYDKACASAGPLLSHITTRDVAQDMDYLRQALGQQKINYYGFSYGTYLGEVYSTLFPHHLRRMVLDSTVDPRGVWYQANLAQDVAFQKTETIWFGWVAKYDSVYHLGKTEADVQALWYREQAALAKHPAGGVVGPDEWTDIFLNAGYYQLVWLDLGSLFADWVHHADTAALVSAYQDYIGPNDDNEFAVYNAVQCTDTQWPTNFATWRTDNWRVYSQAPFETWDNVWFNAPCLYWPAKAHQPVTIDGARTSSVLMIDETLDAATPYEGSLYVRGLYPNASLIAEPGGTTHAGTLFGNACVDDQIAAYLASGRLPARKPGKGPDTTCAPLPQPVPTSASGAAPATRSAPRSAAVAQAQQRTARLRSALLP